MTMTRLIVYAAMVWCGVVAISAQRIMPILPPGEVMGQVIAENDRVKVNLDSNEVTIRGKPNFVDPVKVRLGSHGHTKGVVSFEMQRRDGIWEEVALIAVRQDERERADPFNRTGEAEIFLRHDQPGVPDDQQFIKVVLIRWDGVTFHVPIVGAPQPLQRPIALRSRANGRFVCADSGGDAPLIANRDAIGPWEIFEVVPVS